MNVILKNLSASFKLFLNSQGRQVVFTFLFYALWLAKDVATSQNCDLHAFTGRMIGIATLENYDISARVSQFYKFIGTLLCCFFIFNGLSYFIFKKSATLFNSIEIKIINYTSLAAIPLFLFKAFGYEISETKELLYFLHKLMLAALILRLAFFRKANPTLYNYTFIILLSVSAYFLVADCLALCGTGLVPDFFITSFVISCLLLVSVNLLLQNEHRPKQLWPDKMVYGLLPLLFLPLISVLKDEIFLIFKARHIYLSSPLPIYFALIMLLTGSIILGLKVYKKREWMPQKKMITLYHFPVFIFSMVTFALYSYYIHFLDETFEQGNKFLPIMEFNLFGVIPTLEKFNSHLLADYFFSAIYTLLNGMKGSEMMLYDFLYISVSYILYYYLVLYLSRNAFVALFFILIFPFCRPMLPEQFSFGIFAIFALHKIISQQPSLKNYLVFFITVAGLVLWRIDLGYTCLIVMPGLLLYYHFRSKTFNIKPALLLKGLIAVTGFTAVVIVCISFYRGINLFEKIPYALNYLRSEQTYGNLSLGSENQLSFKIHYFVFPVITALILLALLLKFEAFNKSRGQRLAYLSLIFTCVFYFINFNRGLVRHGLVELTDHYTSSYIYIIIPGAFLLFFQNKSHVFRFVGFFAIAFFLLINYKIPDLHGSKSFFETGREAGRLRQATDLLKIDNRVKYYVPYKDDRDSLFVKFIRKNTKSNETFIDFSNTPMLYFYTKKITPSYFYQNPLCSHNDFLQDRFIADLKDYHTPYIVFSNTDPNAMDNVDNVPNTLRHYRMAEYFYNNYKPYLIAGRFRIWKNKAVKDLNKRDTIYRFIKNLSSPAMPLQTAIKFKAGKKYMARFILTGPSVLKLKTVFSNDTVSQIPEFISDKLAYCVLEPKEAEGLIMLQNADEQLSEFQIIECDYLPDFYAERFLSYYFSKLPYVWGTYDKKVFKEPVLVDIPVGKRLQKNKPAVFKIPATLNRSTGNTILISCRNNSDNAQILRISFGNNKEKNKTKIDFVVMVSGKEENYAIRISSIYKWYSDKVNEICLSTDSEHLMISKIKITKGL